MNKIIVPYPIFSVISNAKKVFNLGSGIKLLDLNTLEVDLDFIVTLSRSKSAYVVSIIS